MKNKSISENTIRRLPRYLRKLDELISLGIICTTSRVLADLMGATASQIRQDLCCFGEFGLQGYGYDVKALRESIAHVLGMDKGHTAILVGVGNVGRALADNFCFSLCGVDLKCAFDTDEKKIGIGINGLEVRSMDTISEYLSKINIDIAVLCVPRNVAISTAALLIENSIEAIWNFTNIDLVKPHSDVIVENVHFSDSLMSLGYYMSSDTGR